MNDYYVIPLSNNQYLDVDSEFRLFGVPLREAKIFSLTELYDVKNFIYRLGDLVYISNMGIYVSLNDPVNINLVFE